MKIWGFAILVVILISGCQAKQDAMSLNLQTWVGHGPIYLAMEKGFFEEENLIVDIVPDEIAENRNFAFQQGLLDAEGSSIDLLIHKRDQGIPVVAVLKIDASVGADGIVSKSSITNVKELSGKTIALERKNVGEAFLSFVLNKNNMSLDDVTLVPVGGSDEAATVFLDKTTDAAVTWEPWLTTVRQQGEADSHVLLTTKEEPGVIVDILVVREKYLEQNPAAVKKFLRGWFKALDHIEKYPEESIAIMANRYDLSTEDYKASLEGLKWPSYEENIADFADSGSMHEVYRTLSDVFLKDKSITKAVDPSETINGNILKNLFEQ